MTTTLKNANIVTAFSENTVGTKVVNAEAFNEALVAAIESTDFEKQDVPGQAFIPMAPEVKDMVSAGVGLRTEDPEDYINRLYRGKVCQFLKRDKAIECDSVAAIVYTADAYKADPDIAGDEDELKRIEGATHILVAILGMAGPKAPLSPDRFVSNMAGGNHNMDFIVQPGGGCGNGEMRCKVDRAWINQVAKLRDDAKEIVEYHDSYLTVAD